MFSMPLAIEPESSLSLDTSRTEEEYCSRIQLPKDGLVSLKEAILEMLEERQNIILYAWGLAFT
jgi:hypothetical protein